VAARSDRPPRRRYRPPPRLEPRRRACVGASSRAHRDGRLVRCVVAPAGTSSRAPVIRARLRSTTATSARSSSGASLVSWAMSATTPLRNALSRTCDHREPAGPRFSSVTAADSRDAFCVVSQDDAGRGQAVASGPPRWQTRFPMRRRLGRQQVRERLHSSSSERVRCASRHARLGRPERAYAARRGHARTSRAYATTSGA
jgi:hypothetical protein